MIDPTYFFKNPIFSDQIKKNLPPEQPITFDSSQYNHKLIEMLDDLSFSTVCLLLMTSYKGHLKKDKDNGSGKHVKQKLEKNHLPFEFLEQREIKRWAFGSWKVTLLKMNMSDKNILLLEGTSSIRNIIADLDHQVGFYTPIINDFIDLCVDLEKKYQTKINYVIGHSAAGLIAREALDDPRLDQMVGITYNSQKPQKHPRIINLASIDDPLTSNFLISNQSNCFILPNSKGLKHSVRNLLIPSILNLTWENILPGYTSPNFSQAFDFRSSENSSMPIPLTLPYQPWQLKAVDILSQEVSFKQPFPLVEEEKLNNEADTTVPETVNEISKNRFSFDPPKQTSWPTLGQPDSIISHLELGLSPIPNSIQIGIGFNNGVLMGKISVGQVSGGIDDIKHAYHTLKNLILHGSTTHTMRLHFQKHYENKNDQYFCGLKKYNDEFERLKNLFDSISDPSEIDLPLLNMIINQIHSAKKAAQELMQSAYELHKLTCKKSRKKLKDKDVIKHTGPLSKKNEHLKSTLYDICGVPRSDKLHKDDLNHSELIQRFDNVAADLSLEIAALPERQARLVMQAKHQDYQQTAHDFSKTIQEFESLEQAVFKRLPDLIKDPTLYSEVDLELGQSLRKLKKQAQTQYNHLKELERTLPRAPQNDETNSLSQQDINFLQNIFERIKIHTQPSDVIDMFDSYGGTNNNPHVNVEINHAKQLYLLEQFSLDLRKAKVNPQLIDHFLIIAKKNINFSYPSQLENSGDHYSDTLFENMNLHMDQIEFLFNNLKDMKEIVDATLDIFKRSLESLKTAALELYNKHALGYAKTIAIGGDLQACTTFIKEWMQNNQTGVDAKTLNEIGELYLLAVDQDADKPTKAIEYLQNLLQIENLSSEEIEKIGQLLSKFKDLQTIKIQEAEIQYRIRSLLLESIQLASKIWLNKYKNSSNINIKAIKTIQFINSASDIIIHPLILRQLLIKVLPTNYKEELLEILAEKDPLSGISLFTLFAKIVPFAHQAIRSHVKRTDYPLLIKGADKIAKFTRQAFIGFNLYDTAVQLIELKKGLTVNRFINVLSFFSSAAPFTAQLENQIPWPLAAPIRKIRSFMVEKFIHLLGKEKFQQLNKNSNYLIQTLFSSRLATALQTANMINRYKNLPLANRFFGMNKQNDDSTTNLITQCATVMLLGWNAYWGYYESILKEEIDNLEKALANKERELANEALEKANKTWCLEKENYHFYSDYINLLEQIEEQSISFEDIERVLLHAEKIKNKHCILNLRIFQIEYCIEKNDLRTAREKIKLLKKLTPYAYILLARTYHEKMELPFILSALENAKRNYKKQKDELLDNDAFQEVNVTFIEKTILEIEEQIKNLLNKPQLKYNLILKDFTIELGDCLFDNIIGQLAINDSPVKLRQDLVEFMKAHSSEFAIKLDFTKDNELIFGDGSNYVSYFNWNDYLEKMALPTVWATELEIQALAYMLDHPIVLFQDNDQRVDIYNPNENYPIFLTHLNGNHFISCLPQSGAVKEVYRAVLEEGLKKSWK